MVKLLQVTNSKSAKPPIEDMARIVNYFDLTPGENGDKFTKTKEGVWYLTLAEWVPVEANGELVQLAVPISLCLDVMAKNSALNVRRQLLVAANEEGGAAKLLDG